MDRKLIVIAHNIRSTHNVGSLLRTCDGLGIEKLYLTGYTPYPKMEKDTRLPHLAEKLHQQIHKTALGAEDSVAWSYVGDPAIVIDELKIERTKIIALEQNERSIPINSYSPPQSCAIVLGEEVNGISDQLINLADAVVEIPMLGRKESYNVAVAAGITLYHFRFYA